jgi:hypothetical protein
MAGKAQHTDKKTVMAINLRMGSKMVDVFGQWMQTLRLLMITAHFLMILAPLPS